MPAITDVVRQAQCECLDGLGRLAGHAKVAAYAIDGPWPQADARQAMILKIDACIAFVAAFEDAVVRRRRKGHVVRDGASAVPLGRAEHRRGAGVNQALHSCRLAHGLEYGQRSQHVHLCAQKRIGLADRHLQAREVNDMRDGVRLDRLQQAGVVRHVSLHEFDLLELMIVEQQPQAVQVLLEVIDEDLIATFEQITGDPTADASVAAREQDMHNALLRGYSGGAALGLSSAAGGGCSGDGSSSGVSSAAACDSASSRAILASEAILSSSLRFMMRTPCVLRPTTRISLTRVRFTIPWVVMTMISSSAWTETMTTTWPLRSLVRISRTH